MDVVYIIGTGSNWQDNELRYSLRSICKFAGSSLDDVYIVGDRLPSWINSRRVRFIQAKDIIKGRPAVNVAWKLSRFFRQTDVGQFLLSSDDHFFIKPVDFSHWPLHYKGAAMPDAGASGVGDRRYTQTMVETRYFMERHGLDLRYWEGHTNKLYSRSVWDWLWSSDVGDDFCSSLLETEHGISINSPMAAGILKANPDYPTKQRHDIKLRHLNTPEDFKQLENAESFSIYDSAIHTGVAEYLGNFFPIPCYFELA